MKTVLVCIVIVVLLLTYFGPQDPDLGLPVKKKCHKCGARQRE